MVGTINAGSIINKVSITAPTPQTEFDSSPLSHTQIATFAKHFTAQLFTIDAQGIIRLVTHFSIILCGGFHIGTNPAVPNQINLGLEYSAQ